MENPATWGKAERVIEKAIRDADHDRERGVIGWSMVACIANALRQEGLLKDDPADDH